MRTHGSKTDDETDRTSECVQCFHFGKSLKTGRVECAIARRCDVDPNGGCQYFVRWS